MKQRRRWINSSLFAFLYVWDNYYFSLVDSRHSCFNKYIGINISMVIGLLSFLSSYITPSTYFFILYTTVLQLNRQNNTVLIIAKIFSIIYVIVYLVGVGGALATKNWSKHAHYVSAVLSFYSFSLWVLVIINIIFVYVNISEGISSYSFYQMSVLVMIGINLGALLLLCLLHLPTHYLYVCKLVKNFISYMAYQGAYSQTMVSNAFCNIDDISWGTKGTKSGNGKKFEK
jgi:chitin synthase